MRLHPPFVSSSRSVRRVLIGVALCWPLLVGGVAAADDYPLSAGSLSTSVDGESRTSFGPGATVRLVGTGFAPGATVTATLYSTPVPLGSFVASATGAVDADVVIPDGAEPGQHTIKVQGAAPGGGTRLLSQAVNIQGSTSSAELAFTGADIAAIAGIGAGAVVAGTVTILAVRRSRARA